MYVDAGGSSLSPEKTREMIWAQAESATQHFLEASRLATSDPVNPELLLDYEYRLLDMVRLGHGLVELNRGEQPDPESLWFPGTAGILTRYAPYELKSRLFRPGNSEHQKMFYDMLFSLRPDEDALMYTGAALARGIALGGIILSKDALTS